MSNIWKNKSRLGWQLLKPGRILVIKTREDLTMLRQLTKWFKTKRDRDHHGN